MANTITATFYVTRIPFFILKKNIYIPHYFAVIYQYEIKVINLQYSTISKIWLLKKLYSVHLFLTLNEITEDIFKITHNVVENSLFSFLQ